ncbi:DUF6717 family protein [Lysobacter sp. Root690]|uniref:DUF6717 family protein n=1 Tax=Lysobacter sp. Root690 TaxID=1736588 RepID=UPI000A4AF1A8|nr:DUF6717 family protein [Lysobacter sp. Root690]
MNAIVAIHPYKAHGMWVFDDAAVGLSQEPFVSGADDIIERMAASIDNAESGFTLLFSPLPFPGFQLELVWRRADLSGNWYRCESIDMKAGCVRHCCATSSRHRRSCMRSFAPRELTWHRDQVFRAMSAVAARLRGR